MILMIDHYDSFTDILCDYVRSAGFSVKIFKSDQIDLATIDQLQPSHIILSPGPGHPKDAGMMPAIIKHYYKTTPILGVCLGHQAIAYTFGAEIISAKQIMHGRTSNIQHEKHFIFNEIPNNFTATRYHSLLVAESTLPDCLEVIATSEQQEIMALQHKHYPTIGVQFHPEAVLTEHGQQLLNNFFEFAQGIDS